MVVQDTELLEQLLGIATHSPPAEREAAAAVICRVLQCCGPQQQVNPCNFAFELFDVQPDPSVMT